VSRLFVAAPTPDVVRADLAARLSRTAEPGVRWVPEEQWHVTLRFLGEADEDDAVQALSEVRAPVASVTLGPVVSRIGRDVVCLPAAGLDDLARVVRTVTTHIGEPPGRPFVGHLTLARLRNRAACGITGTSVVLTYPVTEIVLVRSTLGPRGAMHETLHAVVLDPTW
jgi:2'-5' RNA ligase